MKYTWPITITGSTYHPSGRKRTIHRTVEGAGRAREAITESVLSRPDAWLWRGVEVQGITPLNQVILVSIPHTDDKD